MNAIHNYRMPLQFTIKPSALKPKRTTSNNDSKKYLTKILYCVAHNTEDGWKAHINTRGLEGYEDLTILPFTKKSFELKGRRDVFLHHKDKTGHWVRIMRSSMQSIINPGSPEVYCTLCENDCFTGHIVKIDGVLQFDMSSYKGIATEYYAQLTRINKKDNEEE